MSDHLFRMVCVPAALDGWSQDLLGDGEVALLVDPGGFDAVSAVAHALDTPTVRVVRAEDDATAQERTVIAYAASLPLVWIAPAFSDDARDWALSRGPMTLLVESAGALADDERRRITRFLSILGRQSE
jgi:hypothetical protein